MVEKLTGKFLFVLMFVFLCSDRRPGRVRGGHQPEDKEALGLLRPQTLVNSQAVVVVDVIIAIVGVLVNVFVFVTLVVVVIVVNVLVCIALVFVTPLFLLLFFWCCCYCCCFCPCCGFYCCPYCRRVGSVCLLLFIIIMSQWNKIIKYFD